MRKRGSVGKKCFSLLLYVIAAVALAIDQAFKTIVREHYKPYAGTIVSPRYFFVENVPNRGGAFGFLSDHRGILIACCLAFIIGAVYADRKLRFSIGGKIGLGFLLAGVLSNFIDRILYGAVTDYIYEPYIRIHFNLADLMIIIGISIYCGSELVTTSFTRRRG